MVVTPSEKAPTVAASESTPTPGWVRLSQHQQNRLSLNATQKSIDESAAQSNLDINAIQPKLDSSAVQSELNAKVPQPEGHANTAIKFKNENAIQPQMNESITQHFANAIDDPNFAHPNATINALSSSPPLTIGTATNPTFQQVSGGVQIQEQQQQVQHATRKYRLVLTGGPCGGKTTGQARLASFFEGLGWKVFNVPETASLLFNGGVKFMEMSPAQQYQFQKDLLLTMLQIERVYFNQAELIDDQNVLIICDRGAIDPAAYIHPDGWGQMLAECNLDLLELRDNRYNQVVHMVTAADGAPEFYTLANNRTRYEGLRQAAETDRNIRMAWIGHPYVDIVDNSDCRKFEDKILKLIQVVCDRIGDIGLNYADRLSNQSRKRKWLVRAIKENEFQNYEQFTVRHDYLLVQDNNGTTDPNGNGVDDEGGGTVQVRIRARSQKGRATYTLTTRRRPKTAAALTPSIDGNGQTQPPSFAPVPLPTEQACVPAGFSSTPPNQPKSSDHLQDRGLEPPPGRPAQPVVETRVQLTFREYSRYLAMRDKSRVTLYKKRRFFTHGTVYFHLDIYVDPLPPACNGHPLMILETYTTKPVGSSEPTLPPFLGIVREITDDPRYSMYSLAARRRPVPSGIQPIALFD